jgi:hypothetical protein
MQAIEAAPSKSHSPSEDPLVAALCGKKIKRDFF